MTENTLEITTCDIFDREADSELDEMLDSEYYPSSEDEPDFKVGSVYMISASGTDKVYVGSTVNPSKRWSEHKSRFKTGTCKCTSKFILEYGNYTFTILSQQKFTTTKALRDIEYQVMKQYEGRLVNKVKQTFCKVDGDSKSRDYIKAVSDYKTTLKYTCECCNKELATRHKSTHLKTKKHLTNLQAAENKKELLLKLSNPI
jgi:predicted GIY-YIG superfamily endonuclease